MNTERIKSAIKTRTRWRRSKAVTRYGSIEVNPRRRLEWEEHARIVNKWVRTVNLREMGTLQARHKEPASQQWMKKRK